MLQWYYLSQPQRWLCPYRSCGFWVIIFLFSAQFLQEVWLFEGFWMLTCFVSQLSQHQVFRLRIYICSILKFGVTVEFRSSNPKLSFDESWLSDNTRLHSNSRMCFYRTWSFSIFLLCPLSDQSCPSNRWIFVKIKIYSFIRQSVWWNYKWAKRITNE